MSRSVLLFAVILGVALALRLPQLDLRPMHNDEAVNAVNFTRPLWELGLYAYDPNEYHGPTLHFVALPFLWASGARDFSQVNEATLRLVPVFFGVALIVLLWWLRDGIGNLAALWAALLTAVSPAMVFYSRYFIHEMLLVCFTMLLFVAVWRYLQRPGIGWALTAGAALGLMYATKETFVIAIGAMGVAGVVCGWWFLRRCSVAESMASPHGGDTSQAPAQDEPSSFTPTLSSGGEKGKADAVIRLLNWKHVLAALVVALVVSFLLFTGFLRHWSGPVDSLRSYMPWLHRAGGHSPHIHEFGFYFRCLAFFHQGGGPIWSEGLLLVLAGVGVISALLGKGLAAANVWLARFLAVYTMTLALVYSVISYKTPWCMLGFLHGMILLAGLGAAALVRSVKGVPRQSIVCMLLLALVGQLGWQAWRASFVYETDRRNPYVYSQTVPDLVDLADKIEALAKVHPDGHKMLIKIMVQDGDYWPLPWYLRRFTNTGWWDKVPEDPVAPVMIVGDRLYPKLEERPKQPWSALGLYGLRPGIVLQLCVEPELWQKYLSRIGSAQGRMDTKGRE